MIVQILVVLCLIFIRYLNEVPDNYPPGGWGIPILGMLFQMPKGKHFTKFIRGYRRRFGDIFNVRIGNNRIVYICSPEMIKDVFSRPEAAGEVPTYISSLLGSEKHPDHFFSTAKMWRENRMALSFFHDDSFSRSYMEESNKKELQCLFEELDNKVEEPTIIDKEVTLALLNVNWKMLTGKRFDLDDDETHCMTIALDELYKKFLDGPLEVLEAFPWLAQIPLLSNLIIDKLPTIGPIKKSLKELCTYIEDVVTEHEKVLDVENPTDFIDEALIKINHKSENEEEEKEKMTREDLIIILRTLFVASAEKTPSNLRSFFYFMAAYPDVQDEIYNEIVNVVGQFDPPCMEDADKLPYTLAAVHELNRIGNLIPFISHGIEEDIKVDKYTLPKGTIVRGALYMCNEDSDAWVKRMDFCPENFLDEDGYFTPRKEEAFSFSYGNRMCPAESFAIMSLFIFVSGIIQRYTIEPSPDCDVALDKDVSIYYINELRQQPVVLRRREYYEE